MTKGTATRGNKKMLNKSEKMTIGQVVRDVIKSARDEKRLTCGIYESGLMLEMNPESVMMCVLPENKSDDVTLDIHYTLIEAFCLENRVSLLKVDSSDKLQKLLGDRPVQHPNPTDAGNDTSIDPNDNNFYLHGSWLGCSIDYNCLLIEYPSEKCSELEEDMLEFYKASCVQIPQPVVDLAV